MVVTRPYNGEPMHPGNGNMVALVMDSTDKVDAEVPSYLLCVERSVALWLGERLAELGGPTTSRITSPSR